MNPICNLPSDVSHEIYGYLALNSMVNLSCSCQTFYKVIGNNDSIWKVFFPKISFPDKILAKQYLNLQAVKTKSKLLKRIADFSTKVFHTRKGTLTCIFPFNETYCINLKFDIYSVKAEDVSKFLTLGNFNFENKISDEKQIQETLICVDNFMSNSKFISSIQRTKFIRGKSSTSLCVQTKFKGYFPCNDLTLIEETIYKAI